MADIQEVASDCGNRRTPGRIIGECVSEAQIVVMSDQVSVPAPPSAWPAVCHRPLSTARPQRRAPPGHHFLRLTDQGVRLPAPKSVQQRLEQGKAALGDAHSVQELAFRLWMMSGQSVPGR